MILKAIIIDDEPKSRSVLKILLSQLTKEIEIIDEADNAIDGLKLIQSKSPDIVFLDIQMPEITGFELVEKIHIQKFITIFVTSHEEYAIKAIKSNAFDYILKPIDILDLEKCVEKIIAYFKLTEISIYKDLNFVHLNQNTLNISHLKVHNKDSVEYITTENIIYIKADGAYSNVYLDDDRVLIIAKLIKDIETVISSDNFIRINKSILVNVFHVRKYTKESYAFITMSNGSMFEISRRRKKEIIDFLDKRITY